MMNYHHRYFCLCVLFFSIAISSSLPLPDQKQDRKVFQSSIFVRTRGTHLVRTKCNGDQHLDNSGQCVSKMSITTESKSLRDAFGKETTTTSTTTTIPQPFVQLLLLKLHLLLLLWPRQLNNRILVQKVLHFQEILGFFYFEWNRRGSSEARTESV